MKKLYRVGRPISREVLKVRIWGIPPAGAQASQRNLGRPRLYLAVGIVYIREDDDNDV